MLPGSVASLRSLGTLRNQSKFLSVVMAFLGGMAPGEQDRILDQNRKKSIEHASRQVRPPCCASQGA